MTNTDKKNNLDSIRNCLIVEQIPFDYNAQELTIKIKGLDMTDILLAVHDFCGEKMTDLIKENEQIRHILGEHKTTIAELRKDKEELCHVISESAKVCLHLKEQLTKANEMLNEFMRISEACVEIRFTHEHNGDLELADYWERNRE